jgi:uncharacterized zinc-type alcohol dehydrogenase-like protein
MTMNIIGYAAPSVKTALEPYRFERRIIRSNDVVIEILYCGVSHRNIHYVQNDWRRSIFPFLLGHEII